MRMEVRIVPQKSFLAEIWPFEVLKIAHRGDVGGLDRRIRKLPELAGSCPVPFLSDHTMRGNLSESESRPFLYKYVPCRATPCLSVGRCVTRSDLRRPISNSRKMSQKPCSRKRSKTHGNGSTVTDRLHISRADTKTHPSMCGRPLGDNTCLSSIIWQEGV